MEFKRGDIILAFLKGQGSVQQGLRPCIIVGSDELSNSSPCLKVVPTTTKKLTESKCHIKITSDDVLDNDEMRESFTLCEQEQNIDKSQFVGKFCGRVSESILNRIDKGLLYTLGLS